MQRFWILAVLLIALAQSGAFAQVPQEDEEDLSPPRPRAQAKLGGAGGFTQNLLFLDLDPINELLSSSGVEPFSKNPILLLGGQGYGYIMLVQNLRVGGIGASGSMMTKSLVGNVRREVELSAGYGGVTVDYVIPVIPRVDVSVGMFLGSGGISLTARRDSGLAKTWDGIWNDYGSQRSSFDYTRKLSGSFFIYQPSVNVEVAILRYLGVRLGASYMGMAGGSWKVDDRDDIFGVPDKVSGRGFMLNGGIFLGTFIF